MQESAVSAELHSGFATPNPEFSPVPIWWWSGDALDIDRMRWQIDKLVAQGVHNAVVLNLAPTGPTHGALSDAPHMTTPEWWDIWEQLCAHSKTVGMRLWFYDQFGFSGANLQGKLVVANPDFVGMAVHRAAVDVTDTGEILCPEAGIPIAAQVLPVAEDGSISGAPVPLQLDGKVARWQGQGRARLMIAYALKKGFDYHSPEACAALIDIVHGEFERRLGRFFGTSIVGSFQDELPSVPSWSARFEREFEKRCGYAIGPKIAALWEDFGLDSARVRIDYQRVRAALAEEAIFKPLFDWHERHGLTFGFDQQSPSRAGEPLSTVDQYADYARTHRWYSAPGSDHWGDAKFHSSLAHNYGRPRTWIESFHSSGWGGTLEETFDWLQPWLLAGANLYDPHAVYYSTKGGQWEWAAPSTCWRQPYWRHYKHFADTISRLCWLATRGEHVCDIGVLFPSASVQADMFLDHAGKRGRAAHQAYMDLLGSMIWFNTKKGALPKMLRDFDVLDDDTVAGGSVEQGMLKTRGERYEVLIVPDAWLLETATLRKLNAFADAGGLLVLVGAIPEATDRAEGDADLAQLKALVASGKAKLIAGGEKLKAELEQALVAVPPEIVADGPVLLRRAGDVSLLFVTAAPEGQAMAQPMLPPWAIWDYDTDLFPFSRYNSELRENGYDFDPGRNRPATTARIAGPVGAIEQWDPATGRSKPVRARERAGITEVELDFSESPMSVLVWTASGETRQLAAPLAASQAKNIQGKWRSEIVPTMDNRYGDFTLPAKPGPLPVQVWTLDHREDTSGEPQTSWKDGWQKVPVTDGLRAWQFGPAAAEAMPEPLAPHHAGPLQKNGWQPVHYSLSRGIDHDTAHDKTLGPKGRVPEEFWRTRKMKAGERVQFRTALPVDADETLTLAIGGNGAKTVWWNGRQLADDPGGYLYLTEVKATRGNNLLEVRIEALMDDDLAGYWALTRDRAAFQRPEWLQPADGFSAGTTLRLTRTVEIAPGEEFEAQFGSHGVATLLVNGKEVAMHGAFDPYANWQSARIMRYPLTPYLHPGQNAVEVRFTDIGTPMAMLFDGVVGAPGANQRRTIVSDTTWQATRDNRPVRVELRRWQRNDPRFALLHPRPHPLPRSGWLDPEQPLNGVLDIIPEPNPGARKSYQWFSVPVPPGATAMHLPIQHAEVVVFDAGRQLASAGDRVDLGAAGQGTRSVLVRVKTADGRTGGAVWDGPIAFDVGAGEIALGPWSESGLEFYSGGVAYEQTITVDDPAAWHTLDLGTVRGTAEVEINGEMLGVRVWSPYRFDLDRALRAGENTVTVRVFNTLAPYLKGASPTHTIFRGQDVSGLMGPVSLS